METGLNSKCVTAKTNEFPTTAGIKASVSAQGFHLCDCCKNRSNCDKVCDKPVVCVRKAD